MSDPLSLLRQATIARQPVVSENGNYVFGSIKLPEKTSTCFRRTLKENDYCYTLKDIVLFLANADFGDVEYRKKVIQEGAGVTAIVRNDREALTNYLTGIIDSCPQIDFQLAASYQLPVQNDTILATEQHTMSLEKMQQQRERYIAQMEKTLQKTKSGESSNNDNLKSLKHLKRSSAQAFGGDGEDDAIDRQFLDADLKILESLRSDEIPAQTRSTVLNASSTDFSVVLKLFTEKILKPMQAPSKSTAASASAHNMQARKPVPTTTAIATTSTTNPSSNNSTNIRPSGLTGGRNYPIIIVPNAPTSNITLLNIEEFLGQGIYHTVEEKRKSGMKTSRTVLITRKLSNEKTIIYRVIDDPKHLNDAEWNLVVAVFATGQTWQFKNWKYSTPVSLFENVLGVHVGIDSANVDMNIQSWNCKVLKVNLFKQHINAGAAKEFWMYLDDYMKLRRARPVLPTTNNVPTAVVSQPPHAPLPPSAAAYKQHHHHTAPAPTASSVMRSVPPPPPPPTVPVSAARPLPPVQPAPPTSAAAGVVPPPPPPPQFRPPSSSTHAIK